jgi:hypothetical protein
MYFFYCRKCGTDNETNVCDTCGRTLKNTSARYMWRVARVPVLDGVAVRSILRALLYAELLLLFGLTAAQYLLKSFTEARDLLTSGGLLTALLECYLAGALLGILVLALQGREEVRYVLDPKGALLQTWICPSRLRCWTRFLSYDKRVFLTDSTGGPCMLARETHLLWADVRRAEFRARASRIDLFRPSAFLFMSLKIPRAEYGQAADLVASRTKHIQ